MSTPGHLAISPNGAHLIIAEGSDADGKLWHVDGESQKVTPLPSAGDVIYSVAVTDDGRYAVATHGNGKGRWEIRDPEGKLKHSGKTSDYLRLSWSSAELLAASGSEASMLVDAQSGKTTRLAGTTHCFVDERRLIAFGEEGVLEITVGGKVRTLSKKHHYSSDLIAGHGRVLACQAGSGGWSLLDASNGKTLAQGKEGFSGAVTETGFLVLAAKKLIHLNAKGGTVSTSTLAKPHVSLVAAAGRAYAIARGTLTQVA